MELLLNLASVLSFILSASVMTSDDSSASQPRTMRTIFNFNSEDTFSAADADSWWESSDTVRWVNTGLWLVRSRDLNTGLLLVKTEPMTWFVYLQGAGQVQSILCPPEVKIVPESCLLCNVKSTGKNAIKEPNLKLIGKRLYFAWRIRILKISNKINFGHKEVSFTVELKKYFSQMEQDLPESSPTSHSVARTWLGPERSCFRPAPKAVWPTGRSSSPTLSSTDSRWFKFYADFNPCY